MACNSCIPYVIAFYVLLLAFIAAVLSVYKLSSRGVVDGSEAEAGAGGDTTTMFNWLLGFLAEALDEYGFPLGRFFIALCYEMYRRLSWFNVFIVVLKYVPTGLYMYKTLKSIYITSRERIKQRQMALDDIQLQIHIINSKLCVRDAEFTERTEHLRHKAERLRALRARVRSMIDTDDVLRCTLQNLAEPAPPADAPEHTEDQNSLTQQEESEFVMELMKELKNGEQFPITTQAEKLQRNEQSGGDADEDPESIYSSLSDVDTKDCRIKIVKVTNVYRVACLKHYIKQKRLRRLTQQAILKKKIESIKKLLESWQKSLNAVIYNKISRDPVPVELASQEAMGDYSKANLREFSDSDTELQASCTDVCFDEYNLNWSEAPYNYENSESTEKEIYESPEYQMNVNYPHSHGMLHPPLCDCSGAGGSVLFILPEETSSQVAIEEVDNECRLLVTT